jgi:signal transduction histidine kinase
MGSQKMQTQPSPGRTNWCRIPAVRNAEKIIFSLTCDRVGNIVTVLRDDFQVLETLGPGRNLREVVDGGSTSKVWKFLDELNQTKAAADWTFNVPVNSHLESLTFAGGALNDYLVIVAAANRENIQLYYEELMKISNEHANALRAALKEKALITRGEDAPRQLYQEMMELNNELTNTQRELAKRNHELAKLNQEKNNFLGMAAHDLRTPLNVISGYSDLLRHEWDSISPDERNDILDKMSRSGRYMLNLVDEFLDYAKIESGTLHLRLQQTSIVDVIDHALAQVRPIADGKQIKIHREPTSEPTDLMLDVHRMSQVILNLLTNAIKFSPPESLVTVRVSRLAGCIVVDVEDEGPGIPPDELGRLFLPFSRTSVNSTAGESSTGMGLLIVQRIVNAHRGTVKVTSTVGKGTIFSVELPTTQPG